MNPHERTRRFPVIHGIALGKPRGRSTVMRFTGDIMVYPWIWGRQPMTKVHLALVPYDVVSAYMPRNSNIKRLRTFELVYFNCKFLHQD
jgi:hypothetical protein